MEMLKGGQKKLDKNKDGKLSGADFKLMKKVARKNLQRKKVLPLKTKLFMQKLKLKQNVNLKYIHQHMQMLG